MKINNLPDNTEKYVVARIDESDYSMWYWGSWDDMVKAVQAAIEIGGIVVEREDKK